MLGPPATEQLKPGLTPKPCTRVMAGPRVAERSQCSCCEIQPHTRPHTSLDLSFPIYKTRQRHSLPASSNIVLNSLTVPAPCGVPWQDQVSLWPVFLTLLCPGASCRRCWFKAGASGPGFQTT